MIWWMLALAVLGWAVGRHTGLLVRAPAEHPPDLERLNERLMHVRNVGMRLNELAASEMRLSGEKRQLQSLQKLKPEVEWMLGEVERQMSECAPDSLHPSQAEHLENLLDATGKSLRMLLDIGQHSNPSNIDLAATIQHLYKHLNLLVPDLSKPDLTDFQTIENHNSSIDLCQQIIESFRNRT